MKPEVQPGMVLLPRAFGSHPHVVLSEPFGPNSQVLVVNWTSLDEECIDATCLLEADEHPALRHRSTMAYSRAHLWRKEKILFAIVNNAVVELAPVSLSLLSRINSIAEPAGTTQRRRERGESQRFWARKTSHQKGSGVTFCFLCETQRSLRLCVEILQPATATFRLRCMVEGGRQSPELRHEWKTVLPKT